MGVYDGAAPPPAGPAGGRSGSKARQFAPLSGALAKTVILTQVRHVYYPVCPMDYLRLLEDRAEEHERCRQRRREAETELDRLGELIRSTVRLLPPEYQTRGEHVLDRIEDRPVGLTAMIRLALAEGGWQSPAEIRDFLSQASSGRGEAPRPIKGAGAQG